MNNEIDNDQKTKADTEIFDDEIRNASNTKREIEVNLQDARCIIKSDIHLQIRIAYINGCEYLQWRNCIEKYKGSAVTKNVEDHLLQQ